VRDYCSGAHTLLGGAADAAIVLPPSNFQLKNQGFNDFGLTMQYAPELAFSGTMANKAWAARNPDVPKRVLAAHSKATEDFYDERNRVEAHKLLVRVGGQKVDDIEKVYYFRKNNLFERVGKISQVKLNVLIDAPVGLADLQARGTIERFQLPDVAQLSD
jgi:NitT/TauT family transport system substrate-binding protein